MSALCSQTRDTYNFDNFLVPVATAFGEYDGKQKLGMLRRTELDMLTGPSLRDTRAQERAARAQERKEERSSRLISAMTGQTRLRWSGAQSAAAAAALESFSNSRGDVRSRTAALHSALGVRLYALVEFVLDQKLSRATWPAWNSLLMEVLRSSEAVKQRALFRLPRVYRYSVRYLVASAIVTDTFIMGARAGRLIAYALSHNGWNTFSWFGALLAFTLNVTAAYFVLLLVQGLSMMEQPVRARNRNSYA